MCPQGNPVSVHVLQTLVLYECEKHAREEEWEEAHMGDRISGILMQLISCLQVKISYLWLFPNKSLIETLFSVSAVPSLLPAFSGFIPREICPGP